MTETPESKALRALVTAIKKGQKPDVTAAQRLLDAPEATVELQSRMVDALSEKARTVRTRHPLREELRKRTDAWLREEVRLDRLEHRLDRIVDKAMAPFYRRRDDLISDARAGKLTKKQFDKAVKDFFK